MIKLTLAIVVGGFAIILGRPFAIDNLCRFEVKNDMEQMKTRLHLPPGTDPNAANFAAAVMMMDWKCPFDQNWNPSISSFSK
jgi:hypothetical protein